MTKIMKNKKLGTPPPRRCCSATVFPEPLYSPRIALKIESIPVTIRLRNRIAKMRFDSVFSNVERGDVWQCAFQAVTDLDKHLAILNEHKKDDAIATLLLTNAPRLGDTLRVICDIGVTLHLREDRDHDLIRGFAFKLGKLFIETERCRLGNNAGVIVKIPVRFRRNDFRGLGLCCQQCKECCDQQSDVFGAQYLQRQLCRLLHRGPPARRYRKIKNHLMATRQSLASARGADSNSRRASAQD